MLAGKAKGEPTKGVSQNTLSQKMVNHVTN